MRNASSLLRRSLWLLPAFLLLSSGELPAQEAFPATHIALLRSAGSDPGDAAGVGIFNLDRVSGLLLYRFTLAEFGQRIVTVRLVEPPRSASDQPDTLATQTLSGDQLNTIDGSFQGLSAEAVAALDHGNVSMLMYTVEFPEGYIVGRIEIVPSAIGVDMHRGNETTTVVGGESADGQAFLTVDEATRTASYVVSWDGLTGPATAAHFHRGAIGVAGPPVHPLTLNGDSTIYGVWTGMTDDDLRALKAGEIYINVHTATNPDGEIRDQMDPVEVFSAAIRPSNEVPPVTGSTLAGTGVVILQNGTGPGGGTFLTARTYVTGADVTAAHIHRGAIGVPGTVILGLESGDPGLWETEEDRITDPADLGLIRAGNSYLNYHTAANPDGEARGQLIPSPSNLAGIAVSSVPARESAAAGSALSARFDPRDGIVHFTIATEAVSGSGRLRLYSMTGSRVADIPVDGNRARYDCSTLASGQYLAQLVVDGRIVGGCTVVIVR